MGMRKNLCFTLAFLLAAPCFVAVSMAEVEDYIEVKTQDLLETPQDYWARGIVFKDILRSHTTGKRLRIGDRQYFEFLTDVLESCYADEGALPRLEIMEPDQQYLFAGTVLQRRRRYYVIVKDIKPARIAEDTVTAEAGHIIRRAASEGADTAAGQAASLFTAAEEALFTYSKEQGLSDLSFLSPASPDHYKALRVIRARVALAEQENNVTARELLTQVIAQVLAQSAPTPSPAPPDSPAMEEDHPVGMGEVVPDSEPLEDMLEELNRVADMDGSNRPEVPPANLNPFHLKITPFETGPAEEPEAAEPDALKEDAMASEMGIAAEAEPLPTDDVMTTMEEEEMAGPDVEDALLATPDEEEGLTERPPSETTQPTELPAQVPDEPAPVPPPALETTPLPSGESDLNSPVAW